MMYTGFADPPPQNRLGRGGVRPPPAHYLGYPPNGPGVLAGGAAKPLLASWLVRKHAIVLARQPCDEQHHASAIYFTFVLVVYHHHDGSYCRSLHFIWHHLQ